MHLHQLQVEYKKKKENSEDKELHGGRLHNLRVACFLLSSTCDIRLFVYFEMGWNLQKYEILRAICIEKQNQQKKKGKKY